MSLVILTNFKVEGASEERDSAVLGESVCSGAAAAATTQRQVRRDFALPCQ